MLSETILKYSALCRRKCMMRPQLQIVLMVTFVKSTMITLRALNWWGMPEKINVKFAVCHEGPEGKERYS
jgi:hypothetical protein